MKLIFGTLNLQIFESLTADNSGVEIPEKWEAKKTKEEAERGDRESETDQFSGKDIKNKGEEREGGKGDGTRRKLAGNGDKGEEKGMDGFMKGLRLVETAEKL